MKWWRFRDSYQSVLYDRCATVDVHTFTLQHYTRRCNVTRTITRIPTQNCTDKNRKHDKMFGQPARNDNNILPLCPPTRGAILCTRVSGFSHNSFSRSRVHPRRMRRFHNLAVFPRHGYRCMCLLAETISHRTCYYRVIGEIENRPDPSALAKPTLSRIVPDVVFENTLFPSRIWRAYCTARF